MMDTDFFKLFYTHLEEREFHNVCQNLKQDEEYLEASKEEDMLHSRFKSLALPKEQKETIRQLLNIKFFLLSSITFPSLYSHTS